LVFTGHLVSTAATSRTLPAERIFVSLRREHPMYRTTQDVSRELGLPESYFRSLLRRRAIPEPAKNSSGAYVWTDADVDAVRRVHQHPTRRPRTRPAAAPVA
jgi:hypothetical protein